MKKIKKRLLPLFMAVIMLLGLVPTTVIAAEVTMDLSKAEVSWDYTLTDEEGNSFSARMEFTQKIIHMATQFLPDCEKCMTIRQSVPDWAAINPSGYMGRTMFIVFA